MTRRKTLVFGLVSLALMAIFTLAAAELLARLTGFHPWAKGDFKIDVTPGGRLFTPHPTRGYAQLPGAFVVTLPDGYAFTVTHLSGGLRITHPLATYTDTRSKPGTGLWVARSRTAGPSMIRTPIPGSFRPACRSTRW